MVEYPCGGPKNPNCSKRPTTTERKCQCYPKPRKGRDPIIYKCGDPLPDGCKSRVELDNPDCDRS